jgi:hypothetical protein
VGRGARLAGRALCLRAAARLVVAILITRLAAKDEREREEVLLRGRAALTRPLIAFAEAEKLRVRRAHAEFQDGEECDRRNGDEPEGRNPQQGAGGRRCPSPALPRKRLRPLRRHLVSRHFGSAG